MCAVFSMPQPSLCSTPAGSRHPAQPRSRAHGGASARAVCCTRVPPAPVELRVLAVCHSPHALACTRRQPRLHHCRAHRSQPLPMHALKDWQELPCLLLRELLINAVVERLMSDAPLGVVLHLMACNDPRRCKDDEGSC